MRRIQTVLWLLLFLSVPLWLHELYYLHILIITCIFIIAAMSLNLLLGYTGQLSLGHVAFFGIGAYASALTTLGFDVELFGGIHIVHTPWPALAGLAVGVIVAGMSGYVIGKLSFRVRGAYFVIVTISFAEVSRLVALNWVGLTQGPEALNNIPPYTLGFPDLGYFTLWNKVSYYYFVVFIGAIAYLVISRLVGSRFGRAMVALKENESLAASLGIDVTRYLVLASIASAAIAGAAGSLYAHYVNIIDPDIFAFLYTVTMVIMVITGGKGTLAGPIVGGLIFGFIPVVVRSFAAPAVQWIIYGGLMILIVFLLPQGIVPAVQRWGAKATRRPKPPSQNVVAESSRPIEARLSVIELKKPAIPSASDVPVLAIDHVAVQFGGVTAIADMNFVVREGELLSLIGPNGAGKTTAFNVVTGFLRPTKGEVKYRGSSLSGLKPHEVTKLGLARTFQRTSVFQTISVFDNVLTGLHTRGVSRLWDTLLALPREKASERDLRERAGELLRLVGIEHRADELAGALPYGDQRLLGVALALATNPSMLLLDEPVSGMNASETGSFMRLLERLRETGITILLVEHDMPLVMGVSDRIVVLNYGRIIAEGPPAAIQGDPEVVRAYLGQGAKKRA